MKALLGLKFRFSSYVQTLYQKSKSTQTPFFTINSLACRIIEDPLDFYTLLASSIGGASHRVGLSCLYLSTGPLQRHLLERLASRHKAIPNLQSAMVFDLNRSSRQVDGESPKSMLKDWAERIGQRTNIGFQKIASSRGVLSQVAGVHHQKIYIIDDRVILSGANLSKNYFLNRKDRALLIDSPSLSDYLYQYVRILAENPSQQQLKIHYRLWKYAHMPQRYCETFQQQVEYLSSIEKERNEEIQRSFTWQNPQKAVVYSKNAQIAKQIGTSIKQWSPIHAKQYKKIKQNTRDNLFGINDQSYVGNELEELEDKGYWNAPIKAGKSIYLFPFIQWKAIGQEQEYKIFRDVLKKAATEGNSIKLTSGYLNLENKLFVELAKISKREPAIQIVCAAPEANSFYRDKFPKYLVPYMYRCYELALLQSMGTKLSLKEYFNGRWSYHAKGVWIEQAQNSILTIIGSSNFNQRSRYRDSQMQFYIYSGCQDFNQRLKSQWEQIDNYSKKVQVQSLQKDDDIQLKWYHRWLAWLGSSIL